MDQQTHDAELSISSSKRPAAQVAARHKKNDELQAKAREMRERAASEEPAPAAESQEPPPAPRERVESIEVELMDGRKVVYGPPNDVSLTMRIALTIPEATTNPVIDRLARVLLSIRSVNGQKLRSFSGLAEMTKLANEIGDVGIDELHFWFEKYWGNLRISDAQLLKKNLRE